MCGVRLTHIPDKNKKPARMNGAVNNIVKTECIEVS